MIRRTSISASSVLVITLSNCTLWGVNQQEGGGEGTGSTTGPSGTTQVSNGEFPTSATSLDSRPSEPAASSSSTTNGLADTGTRPSTTEISTDSSGTTLDNTSSDPTNDPSSGPTNDPGENCMSDPTNYVIVNGDAEDCRARSDVRFVFVTSVVVAGDMNGSVPDLICNELANGAQARPLPAPNKFRAWASTEMMAPALWADFDQFNGPFVKYDTILGAEENSVVVVAENWQGVLAAGTNGNVLSAPIDVTDMATQVVDDPNNNKDALVWTGTSPGGTLSYYPSGLVQIFNCTNWTMWGSDVIFCENDKPKLGELGKIGAVNKDWTQFRDGNCEDNRCNETYSLYCIQTAV